MGDNADFIEQQIEQQRTIGQKAAIRFMDATNPEDVKHMQAILRSPEIQRWMEDVDDTNKQMLMEWASEHKRGKGILFAISGSSKLTNLSETGNIQGFVYFYPSKTAESALEISYAKRPGAESGQIASGVRQACIEAARMFNERNEIGKPQTRIVAEIDPENRGSVAVVKSAGFRYVGDKVWELEWDVLEQRLKEASYREWKVPTSE